MGILPSRGNSFLCNTVLQEGNITKIRTIFARSFKKKKKKALVTVEQLDKYEI